MHQSLRALLAGSIDYAGLFPPAKLPLDEALRTFLDLREGPNAWMLGRFVCPASRLGEIPEGTSLTCSAIGRGGDTAEAFLTGLKKDLADLHGCRARRGGQVVVDVVELKLPVADLDGHEAGLLLARAGQEIPSGIQVYLEASIEDLDRLRLVPTLAGSSLLPRVGYKLRAGGLTPSATPSSADVAGALSECIHAEVPFKATAGLHHPLAGIEPGGARRHGFVNLFTAGVLIYHLDIPSEMVQIVLEDDDPAHFHFTDERLRWGEFELTTEEIVEARQTVVRSFGSCSFDEPRDDLRALGWL